MDLENVANAIDKQKWIDAGSDPVQKVVRSALQQSGPLKDFLHGTWFGHPLHPALIAVPVGAWTLALTLDAVESISGRKELRAGADFAVGAGVIGALASAVTGLADWSETDFRAKKIGFVHAVANIAATSLYAASWILRGRRGSRRTGVALSTLGYLLASGGAYLGGHLVFGEQVGVDHTATADATKPEEFTSAMKSTDLHEDKPTRAVADGVAILLVKRGERIYAITETCPHLGGPLSEGKLVGGAIQCPWHGSQLALKDGSVVCGPTVYPARCFEVRVRGGYIQVRAASKQAVAD
jgi:nitrite reductase/ring-hydroxylating ferredoxin subunit/uncharacterized membrane protein